MDISLFSLGNTVSSFFDFEVPLFILGRVGNFINGELWGHRTSVPWCVVFPDVDGCRHPAQLYDGLARLITLVFIVGLSKMKLQPGVLMWSFLVVVNLGRFITDFWREDILYVGLTLGQWYSLVFAVIAGIVLWKKYKS